MKVRVHLAAALLISAMCPLAAAQPVEVSWELQHNAGGQGEFVQTDALGNTYVIESNSGSTASLDIYDLYGDLISSRSLAYKPTGLAVDPYGGTAFVSVGSSVEAFYWDGNGWGSSSQGTLLSFNSDSGGRAVMVYSDSTHGVTRIETYPDGDNVGSSWTVPYAATAGYVDGEGDVLLVETTGNFKSGSQTVTMYTETGQQLWMRSYSHSYVQGGSYYAGLVEDDFQTEYLITNGHGSLPNSDYFQVEAINPASGSTDIWESQNEPGVVQMACTDALNVYLELTSNQLVAMETNTNNQTPGTVAWTISQAADQLTFNGAGAVVGVYNSTSKAFQILNFSSTNGARLSGQTVPASSASDEGQLIGGEGFYATYVGATGGTNSMAVIAKLIYGAHLSKVVLPASVVGGSPIPANFELTALPIETVFLGVSSNFPKIADPPSTVDLSSLSTVESIPTVPVDADTVVSFTSTETAWGVRRFSTTTVATAQPASVKPAVSSIASGKTTTATITLNGPAGPSGKTIALSSNFPDALTLPASVSIGAGKTTATVTLTAHTVTKNTVVTITAKIGTHDAFGSITVTP